MRISDILSADAIFTEVKADGKRQFLKELSSIASKVTKIDERTLAEAIMERENLGSTGYGKGTAFPHARVEGAKSVQAVFARLSSPIDFNAVDSKFVDLVFMLVSPENNGADHLTALATLSRVLKDDEVCSKLRKAKSREEIYTILNS
jgi:PTS system nitrogen regulatory IIA component